MKSLQDAVADDDDRAVVPGLAGFRLVSDVGLFVTPAVAKSESIVAWRKRSTVVIETVLAWHVTNARNRAQLSQAALANAVGRPQSFIGKIEMNRRNLRVTELVQLSAAMGQNPCELLTYVVQTPSVQEVLAIMEVLKSGRMLPRDAVGGSAP